MTNAAAQQQQAEDAASFEPSVDSAAARRLDMMLTTGGDDRIWPGAVLRRNRYGAPAQPTSDEIWFASSMASAISPRGYAAAQAALAHVSGERPDLPGWFDELRARIVKVMGVPGAEVVLAPSAAELEFAALAIVAEFVRRPISNIVVAPDDAGSAVHLAARGEHFTSTAPFEPNVEKGGLLSGWTAEDIVLTCIERRESSGRLRAPASVDRAVCAAFAQALAEGRGALLHVLDDATKGGASRDVARALAEIAATRVVVVVDACPMRCSFEQIADDLADGFLVMVTGSEFAGGPAFSGALLIPPQISARLDELRLPPGFAAYSARLDWPERFADAFEDAAFAPVNLGLGLRWSAALAEIEAYAALPSGLREDVIALFAEHVRRGVARNDDLDFVDPELWRIGGAPPTSFAIVTGKGDVAQARLIYESLRASDSLEQPEFARSCHVGQPIVIGGRAALRLGLSMSHVVDTVERFDSSLGLDAAFQPLRREIELVFRKWGALQKRFGADGRLTLAASNEA